jgi:hypothetical protein
MKELLESNKSLVKEVNEDVFKKRQDLLDITNFVRDGGNVANVFNVAENIEGGFTSVLEGLNQRKEKGPTFSLELYEVVRRIAKKDEKDIWYW